MLPMLSRMRKDSNGITGIETAIILLAFIMVSSVFAYTVLFAGILASAQGKAAIFSGLKASGRAMEIEGSVSAKSLSFMGESLGTGDGEHNPFHCCKRTGRYRVSDRVSGCCVPNKDHGLYDCGSKQSRL